MAQAKRELGNWVLDTVPLVAPSDSAVGAHGFDGLLDQKPPARAKVDSYPVQERYGIVFAFLGDLPEDERPPLHDIEEYGTEGWKTDGYTDDL